MKSFFRSSGVKAVAAILCIVCLSAALLSGLFLTAMLAVGEFDGSGSLQELALENQLSRDCHKVMYNYFDPSEPSAPWQSYYSEGIYTGENSNFRYNVVDAETGYSVLSTVVGGEQVRLRREYTHVFETEIQRPIQDRYTVSDIVFSSGGITYLYSEESDYFYPVYDENVLAYLSPINIGDEVFRLGFTYAAPDVPVVETAIVEPSAISPVYINESHFEYDGEGFFRSGASVEYVVELKEYTIIGYVLYDLEAPDEYSYRYETARIISGHRQDLILLFGITTVLGLVLLITLCRNVGRIKGQDAPVVPLGLRLPWDLMAAVLVFAGCLGFVLLDELRYIPNYQFEFPAVILVVLALTALAVYLLCIFCVRAKTHTLGRGSLIFRFFNLLFLICKKLPRWGERCLRRLTVVWKTAVCYGLICFIELIVMCMFSYSIDGALAALWFIEKLLLGVLVMYAALAFRRLKMGAESIAGGDYTASVDENHLVLDFKDAAQTLNNIRGGMNTAVESRMKSERLKTELITNVSHDIKTPLTSIVSYVDLLKQEPAGSENAAEYIQVLERQSARLKKLVEDLVEASKASTGNIAVHAEAMDLGVVLGQALGEYAQRLGEQGLSPVVKTPEEPVMVSADGRLLWRVFDNLLGNAVKYALPGTRLYVTLTADSHAIVTFRNISREPLDVSVDELMERFVRGDTSRHTEGSGLGLSIAKSLVESMGGEFLLSVDGDLFKAAVVLPLLSSTPETETQVSI